MVHECSLSKLPTIQVLRHKLYPEQEKHDFTQTRKHEKYQPSSAGGTRSPPAMPHRLQNPKWPPVAPKMADGVLKGVQPKVIGHAEPSKQVLSGKVP